MFTANDDSSDNYIYRVEKTDTGYKTIILFHEADVWKGAWDPTHPIEAIGVYENERIQKVYWTDGINSPRVINIMNDEANYKPTSFDFIQPSADLTIGVDKEYGTGMFPSGTIQYFITYYNKHLQQTGIVNSSPVLYLDADGMGSSPEDRCSCSFKLTLSGVDLNFDYVRIYSLIRTSLNSTPTIKKLVDLPITSRELHFTDTGTIGETEDGDLLLYLQNQKFTCSTMVAKDNTLFLGDISFDERQVLTEDVKKYIQEHSKLSFEDKITEGRVSSIIGYNGSLSKSRDAVASFKYDEVYRIGVQFRTEVGTFSAPLFLGDLTNPIKPYVEIGEEKDIIHTSKVKCILNLPTDFPSDYVSARLIMVNPNNNNRRILCQGIVCPTVFNVGDRTKNSPYAQASWTIRNPGDHYRVLPSNTASNAEIQNLDVSTDSLFYKDLNQQKVALNYWYKVFWNDTGYSWVSFRWEIPSRSVSYTEKIEGVGVLQKPEIIQEAYNRSSSELGKYINAAYIPSKEDWLTKTEDHKGESQVSVLSNLSNDEVSKINSAFCVDSSIVTLFSPDKLDSGVYRKHPELKFRIIGYFLYNQDNAEAAYNILSTTPAIDGGKVTNNFNELYSAPLWNSRIVEDNNKLYTFVTYMWHGPTLSGSRTAANKTRESSLESKTFRNTRWVTKANYLSSPWSPTSGTESISLFESNELDIVPIKRSFNMNQDLYYMGNIDTSTICPYSIVVQKDLSGARDILSNSERTEPIRITYKTSPHSVIAFRNTPDGQVILPSIGSISEASEYDGVPIWETGKYIKLKAIVDTYEDRNNLSSLVAGDLVCVKEGYPISKYNGNGAWQSLVIPTGSILYYDKAFYEYSIEEYSIPGYDSPFFRNKVTIKSSLSIVQDKLGVSDTGYPIYIGELYIDSNSDTLYGDHKIPDVLKSHMWVPIGKLQKLMGDSTDLYGEAGDTYYQRWDCLMTYPYTKESINKVIDITSFMVESRTNLDGRYDKRRGNLQDLTVTPQNFNILNEVYSQTDNFFNYRILDEDYYKLHTFANQITWSKEKHSGEEIDTWANITLANTLDMSGDKGRITALKTWNEYLLCFQEKALSQILFNSRVQIPTTDGVPIEISNGYKVDGSRLLSGNIGCSNKWATSTTTTGIYFLDSTTDSLYIFNGQLSNLSEDRGMDWWVR